MKYSLKRRFSGVRLWRKNKSVLYNLHPPTIPADGARFTYTFGLGGLTLLATLITILTGVLLTFYFVPTTERAYPSLTLINSVVNFGGFVRSLHYWAAQLTVIFAALHLARIVFTGAYRPPRDFNWALGLGLFVLLLLWDFTGYTLRWDEGSIWALLVGTNLLKVIPRYGDALYRLVVGDTAPGDAALLRFYAWHVVGLTVATVGGIGYHLWRVRVDGGISHPHPTRARPKTLVSRDALFSTEIIAAIIATAAMMALAAIAPPALGRIADLSATGITETKAPWIFLAIQELLRYLPPLWAGWIVPSAGMVILLSLPLFDRHGAGRGKYFSRARWQSQAAFAALAAGIIFLSVMAALR